MKYREEYRNPEITKGLIRKINEMGRPEIRLMEVCGTHTMAIFRSGVRSVLPETVSLLSGPGCPVCVTSQKEIDSIIELSGMGVILTTFGDLIRVPGTETSLQRERAGGCDVRIVYSAFDAVEIAKKNPDRDVVFAGVGFETTAPTIAASILTAAQQNVSNFSVFSAHKLVPPALFTLMASEHINIDGFLLPGHVSVIIGEDAYRPFFDAHPIPCVIAGFEPGDLAHSIYMLIVQIANGAPDLENAYPRAVTKTGNTKAQTVMDRIFIPRDSEWRGLGEIPGSGLKIRNSFESFDAEVRFNIPQTESREPKGCACGKILTGVLTPPQCPLYKKSCSPENPVGPCMVSSEGTCAAYFKYYDE